MRQALTDLYEDVQRDRSLRHLRERTRFVPGEGCEYFPLVLFVGEAPGATEEEQGRPFVGASGRLLRRTMQTAGFSEDNCFITNLVKYRPPNNRPPTPNEAAIGRHYAVREMAILTPEVVVPLGSHAAKALLGPQSLGITTLHGVLLNKGWRSYFPVIHPSAVLRGTMSAAQYSRAFLDLRRLLG